MRHLAAALPPVALAPFCLGPILARALASHNHEPDHGFACSCPSALFVYGSSSTCPRPRAKVPRAPVSVPTSHLSHKLHLHLIPIAPYQNFAVACGLTRCVSVCPSPYAMGRRLLQGIIVPVGRHVHIFVRILPSCRVLTFARSILELLGLTASHGDTMTHGRFVRDPLQPLLGRPTR